MPKLKKNGIALILGNFSFLLASSCRYYIMILRKRGKFGISKVYTIEEGNSDILETSMERRSLEINAAIRSLESNIFLCAVGVIIFSIGSACADHITVIILILIKGLTPVITTVANFEKIQQLVLFYFENFKVTL